MLGYKYRPINKYSLDILESNNVYFSKYTDFNDPFEFCTPFPNLGKMYQRAADEIDKLHKSKIFSTENHAYLIEICKKISTEGSKNLDKTHSIIRENLEKVGIYSLSEVNDEILMWSHYADNHRGFCIGFKDLHKNTTPNTKPLPINYKSTFTDLSDPELIVQYFKSMFYDYVNLSEKKWQEKKDKLSKITKNKDDQRCGISILTDKYEKWAYEREFRLIDEKNYGLRKINPECINSITFGLRTSQEDINKIITTCIESNKNNINYFKIEKSKDSFKVIATPY